MNPGRTPDGAVGGVAEGRWYAPIFLAQAAMDGGLIEKALAAAGDAG